LLILLGVIIKACTNATKVRTSAVFEFELDGDDDDAHCNTTNKGSLAHDVEYRQPSYFVAQQVDVVCVIFWIVPKFPRAISEK
jgi:hypothetical protein